MNPAKLRSLSVRPYMSADLTFPVPGILALQGPAAALGQTVSTMAGRLDAVRDKLSERVLSGSAKGRVVANSAWIEAQLAQESLFTLRNGKLAAELDQTIANHHGEYLERLADSAATGPILRAENLRRTHDLGELTLLFEKRHQELAQSYASLHNTVVSSTSSLSRHEADTPAVVRTYSAPTQLQTPSYSISIQGGGIPSPPMTHKVDEVLVNPRTFRGGSFQPVDKELTVTFGAGHPNIVGILTQVSETAQKPVITVTDIPEHAHPSIDERIGSVTALGEIDASHQSRIVRDMRLAHYETVIDNEDEVLLLDVRKRQLAYLDTFLVPPFRGRIAAIYKDMGEYVQAGEPVLRIENDERLRLVGRIQFKGLVSVGDKVTLKVRNLFEGSDELAMAGAIVSVRGHDADDDEWDVIIDVDNRDGQQITHKDRSVDRIFLPINLQFDHFETDISIGRP